MSFVCDCGKTIKVWIDPDKKMSCPHCSSELRHESYKQLKIYDSVPMSDGLDDSDLEKIKDLLVKNRGSFFRSKQIADHLKINDKGSCPKIRKAITQIVFMGYPVVSTIKGYSLPNNKDQVKAYIDNLSSSPDGEITNNSITSPLE